MNKPLSISKDFEFNKYFTLNNMYIEQHCSNGFLIAKYCFLQLDKPAPILVSGQPGQGKTSFCNYLIKSIIESRIDLFPVYIAFNRISEDSYFRTFLKNCIGEWFDDAFVKRNRIVFIFDGIDESQIIRGKSSFLKILDEIFTYCEEFNDNEIPRIKCIFTGRNTFVDVYKSNFPLETDFIEISDFNLSEQERWLVNFNKITNSGLTLEKLHFFRLSEFLGQPVLLTIICFLIYENDKFITEIDHPSRELIYNKIIEFTYNKKWSSLTSSNIKLFVDSIDSYVHFLSHVAWCTYFNGKNNVSESDLKYYFKSLKIDITPNAIDYISDVLKAARISFYFQSYDKHNQEIAFEFIHKSFEDYLVSLYLSKELRNLLVISDNNKYINTVIEKLFELFYFRDIDYDKLEFLKGFTSKWNADDYKKFLSMLVDIWRIVLSKKQFSFLDYDNKKISRHLSSINFCLSVFKMMLYFVNDYLLVCKPQEHYFNILQDQDPKDALLIFLNYINSSYSRRISNSITSFYKIDFSNLDLSNTNLDGIRFIDCNFTNADLSNCSLRNVSFDEKCILDRTNISFSNLALSNLAIIATLKEIYK